MDFLEAFAFTKAEENCPCFWTAPVLWRFCKGAHHRRRSTNPLVGRCDRGKQRQQAGRTPNASREIEPRCPQFAPAYGVRELAPAFGTPRAL